MRLVLDFLSRINKLATYLEPGVNFVMTGLLEPLAESGGLFGPADKADA
jgi:hypothetical protein